MTIDQMCADAVMRCNETINRSAGQHSRHIRAGFVTAHIRMSDGYYRITPKTEPEKDVPSDVDGGNFWLPYPGASSELTTAEALFVWLLVTASCCFFVFAVAFFAGWISGQF